MAKDRRGRAARTEAATEQPASSPYPDDIRFRVFRIAGASVHAALANEVGQRIVRGDYPPGTILPNEQKWSQMLETMEWE
jgi:hypothetical protein